MMIRKALTLILAACAVISSAALRLNAEDNDAMMHDTASLLNDLNVFSGTLRVSETGREDLEAFYEILSEDIDVHAFDSTVQSGLESLKVQMEQYRFLPGKRDRLKYISDQNQAYTMRREIEDPLGIISPAQTMELRQIADSAFLMDEDYTEFWVSSQSAGQYLADGMNLEDEETEAICALIDEIISEASAVIDSASPYLLSREDAYRLAEALNSSDASAKLQFLKDSQETYQEYGGYWLAMAESCYEAKDYDGCLDAIETYEKKQPGIYKSDLRFLNVLPFAAVSAQKTVSSSTRLIDLIDHYLYMIKENASQDDWALRYFAAQAYLFISRKVIANPAVKQKYLDTAWSLIRSGTEPLVQKQKEDNRIYLSAAALMETPQDADSLMKLKIKEYNAFLKDERVAALPPVSQPLMLYCDLLFGLCDILDVSSDEVQKISSLLHENGEPLFLNEPLDGIYHPDQKQGFGQKTVTFDKKNITVPADLLAQDFRISAEIDDGENVTVFDDFAIRLVSRETENDIRTFTAILSSEEIRKFRYRENMMITITLLPSEGMAQFSPETVKFRTVKKKVFWFFDKIELESVS